MGKKRSIKELGSEVDEKGTTWYFYYKKGAKTLHSVVFADGQKQLYDGEFPNERVARVICGNGDVSFDRKEAEKHHKEAEKKRKQAAKEFKTAAKKQKTG